MYTTLLIIFVIAAAVAFWLLPHVVTLSHTLHLYDMPDSRKVHVIPVPRLGGTVFLPIATIVITATLVVLVRFDYHLHALWDSISVQHFLSYLCGAMSLYAIGLYDDIHGVGYRTKFVIQIGAAAILCVSGLWISDFSYISIYIA